MQLVQQGLVQLPRHHPGADVAEEGLFLESSQGVELLQGWGLRAAALDALRHPAVLQHLSGAETGLGKHCEQPFEQIFRTNTYVVPGCAFQGVLPLDDMSTTAGTTKGRVSRKQHEEHTAQSPKVLLFVALITFQHLWCRVNDRADLCLQLRSLEDPATETEIYDLHCDLHARRRLSSCVHVYDHDVFGLDVPVNDTMVMAVGERRRDLHHHLSRVALVEGTQLCDAVEKLTAVYMLHDDVQVLGILEHLQEPADARMVQRLHQIHLGAKVLDCCLRIRPNFVEAGCRVRLPHPFDRDGPAVPFLIGTCAHSLHCQPHVPESALAKLSRLAVVVIGPARSFPQEHFAVELLTFPPRQ
mmetsp:Transcript_73647/g.204752  ORF Transcript_73647/g.204752 Transcript_73647/m.204752 type:complete len:357 (+) Transcript_73647:693-1763(+)